MFDKDENVVFALNTYDGTSNIVAYDIIDSSLRGNESIFSNNSHKPNAIFR